MLYNYAAVNVPRILRHQYSSKTYKQRAAIKTDIKENNKQNVTCLRRGFLSHHRQSAGTFSHPTNWITQGITWEGTHFKTRGGY
jgi:hypothetical protein